MEGSELKACPHCGGESEFQEHPITGSMLVHCPSCDTGLMDWRDWNTRPIEDALTAQLRQVEGERDELRRLILDFQDTFFLLAGNGEPARPERLGAWADAIEKRLNKEALRSGEGK